MSLASKINIDIDFYDKKYILINAKQLDRGSRFIVATCYNHGEIVPINSGDHAAYIRYKKPDEHCVYNVCNIVGVGKIQIELTEQMLATEGICYADLVVFKRNQAIVNLEPIEIESNKDVSILSTITFCVDVSESCVAHSDVESSYEFNLVTEKLSDYWSYYEDVITTSKSYAVGGTDKRENEDTDNAKYYYEQSKKNASNAKTSEINAATSESNSKISETNALTSENNAKDSEEKALVSEQNAKTSEQNAKTSEVNARLSETNAKTSESNAAISESNAQTYMDEAYMSETNAKTSEVNALDSANKAQSYAVGGTGTRSNEDYDNASYYYNLTKNIVIGLDTGFIPMGTISFAELANVEKATGYVYNIRDDFTTTNDFREGQGKSYAAGTNVYICADGMIDCFGGAASPTATVDEVKDYLGINEEIEIV